MDENPASGYNKNRNKPMKGSESMNRQQHLLLRIFVPWTVLILLLNQILPDSGATSWLKFGATATLALTVLPRGKKTPRKKLMALAFLFAAIGDFFLVLLQATGPLGLIGASSFLAAYLLLIRAYGTGRKPGLGEAVAGLPFLLLIAAAAWWLSPSLGTTFSIGGFAAGLVLSLMAWSAVRLLFGGPFKPATARLLAASGMLMFLCDLGVALGLHPSFTGSSRVLLEQIIWAAYLPGWTLLALDVLEDESESEQN